MRRFSFVRSHHNPLSSVKDQSLIKKHGFINNEWVGGDGFFDVNDPSTGQKIAEVSDMGASLSQASVDAASKAFNSWKNTPVKVLFLHDVSSSNLFLFRNEVQF